MSEQSERLVAIGAVLAVSAVCLIGDYFLKIAGTGKDYINLKPFIAGTIIYGAAATGFFFGMKHLNLATVGIYYSLSTIIFMAALGHFAFNETLSPRELAGIGLGIASMLLLARVA